MDDLGEWIGKILGWIFVGFVALCVIYPLVEKYNNYQKQQKLKQQQEIQSELPRWTEHDRIEQEKKINQLNSKFEKKIQKLGYTKVSAIYIGVLNSNYAVLHCPVKISGDKVYTLSIYFKKFQEFEIIRVDLWDEGNMTKRQLE